MLGIFNIPTESATGWSDIFDTLKVKRKGRPKDRGLIGIKGPDVIAREKFHGTPLQRCVTHLKRNMFAEVSHGDKGALASDLQDIFRTDSAITPLRWQWHGRNDRICVRGG